MDDEGLRIFLRIADLGSFSRAGQTLNISQPALSRRVAILEHELGSRLFVRHQRGVQLTPAGEILRHRAGHILREMHSIAQDVASAAICPTGELAIGLPPSLIQLVTADLATECRSAFPQVQLFFYEGINTQLEQGLVDGSLDLAIMPFSRARLANVEQEIVATEDIVALSAPGILAETSEIDIDRAAGFPLLLAKLPNHIRWRVEVAFKRHELVPHIAAETNSRTCLLELCKAGLGLAFMPRSAGAAEIAEGSLKATSVAGLSISWMIATSQTPSLILVKERVKSIVIEVIGRSMAKNGQL